MLSDHEPDWPDEVMHGPVANLIKAVRDTKDVWSIEGFGVNALQFIEDSHAP